MVAVQTEGMRPVVTAVNETKDFLDKTPTGRCRARQDPLMIDLEADDIPEKVPLKAEGRPG